MARKTKTEALETRAEILEAAIQVFLERGVAAATLEQIAERAGFTRGAVYWHFKNKLEIFEQLVEDVHLSFIEGVLSDLDVDHPQPLEQLRNRCVDLLLELEHDKRSANILRIIFLRGDLADGTEALFQRRRENKQRNLQLIAAYFQRALKKGHLSQDADPEVLALSLMCYLSGIALEHFRDEEAVKLERNAAKMIDQFLAGLSCNPCA